jgi:hypothetical protein
MEIQDLEHAESLTKDILKFHAKFIKSAVHKIGGSRELSRQLRFSESYVSKELHFGKFGRLRSISLQIREKLGYKKIGKEE